jgi:peptidoglycan/LPS O-acetylase OafA/YrhL
MQTQVRAAREFRSVQYLRGLAALGVVYFHTKIYLADFSWFAGRQFGFGGVDIFFAISGFIMMVTTSGRRETPGSFYAKRAVRVVPMYWGATLASAALFLLIPSAFIKQSISLQHVLLSMLFIPHVVDGETSTAPFFKIGWTLNFEMFFYLVFGLALVLRSEIRRLAVVGAIFFGLVAFGAAFEPRGPALGYYTSPFLFEFLMGMIVGYMAHKNVLRHITPIVGWAGICVALACILSCGDMLGDDFSRVLLFGFPAASILAFSVGLEARGHLPASKILDQLGAASYSIYLAHPFVLTGFKVLARATHFPSGSPVVGALGVIASTCAAAVIGYVIYRTIEKPILNFMRRRLSKTGSRGNEERQTALRPAEHALAASASEIRAISGQKSVSHSIRG